MYCIGEQVMFLFLWKCTFCAFFQWDTVTYTILWPSGVLNDVFTFIYSIQEPEPEIRESTKTVTGQISQDLKLLMNDGVSFPLRPLLCRTSWWIWPKRWPMLQPWWCSRPRTWPRFLRTLCCRTGSLRLPPSAPCPPPSWWHVPRYSSVAVGSLIWYKWTCSPQKTKHNYR